MMTESDMIAVTPIRARPYRLHQIKRWMTIIEERDDSVGHGQRVANYAVNLAALFKLDGDEVEVNALLHDVGKMMIPNRILQKPTSLTPREFQMIKFHPRLGAQIIENIPGFQWATQGARYHHERFDGLGYPFGLKGEEIPLIARVICVVDSLDAMLSARPYGEVLTLSEALGELSRCKGTQFDPDVVDALLEMVEGGFTP